MLHSKSGGCLRGSFRPESERQVTGRPHIALSLGSHSLTLPTIHPTPLLPSKSCRRLLSFLSSCTGFKETAFLYAMSAAALTHALARACSAGRMERCTCDDSPGLESRQAWQWGVCGDNLKYSTKFLSNFLGPKRGSKDLRARADAHNTHVGIKVSVIPGRVQRQ